MIDLRRKFLFPSLVVAIHLLACAVVVHFVDNWDGDRSRSRVSAIIVAAALLVCLGADLGLLGLWAAMSAASRPLRLITTVVSVLCWDCIYDPRLPKTLLDWPYLDSPWGLYLFVRCATVVGLPGLTILLLDGALSAMSLRGVRLRPLTAVEIEREANSSQFQVAHLLLFVAVVSLFLAFSVNCRDWLSSEISMRWRFPAHAPFQSAETVIISALLLATATLGLGWATLSPGRPWLRLLMAFTATGFLGYDWAYSFTARQHNDQLLWNGLFSTGVALLQAALIVGVLMVARLRGYRLVRIEALPTNDA